MWRGERRIRVLITDDEEGFRKALARRLERRGAVVTDAADGKAALASLGRESVDVVLLDVKMPGMSGLETLERIKADHPWTEVILITGQASTRDGVAGIKAGAFDYLSKPIEIDLLVEKIREAFDKLLLLQEKDREARYRARMEQQLAATERLASLGTLSAGVAHEINNPLAIINQASGYLRAKAARDETLSPETATALELALGKIDKNIKRAKRITHQLLSFCRQQDSMIKRFDLAELAREVAELTREIALDHRAELEIIIETGDPELYSDPFQVRQVLLNIVNNGLQAVSPGGRVILTISGDAELIWAEVLDNGPGIPPENIDRIFEPFFTTKPPGQGTGLGLSVSKGIVEKLGGRIEVRSALGSGSVFRMILPRKPAMRTGNGDISGT